LLWQQWLLFSQCRLHSLSQAVPNAAEFLKTMPIMQHTPKSAASAIKQMQSLITAAIVKLFSRPKIFSQHTLTVASSNP
jgi:hypothetical protein